ncbi:hypothetical protein [Aureimonas jatrophae]|uniref:Uncharacterized protein n=1 Tax=Aureimonas jatrophae TaxID=1166073 RepID=A0A1H0EL77_9HYPH|nr:hypothetical protein [Aureimonas jatrophae]MBB3950446.1 hypothetical protein [Aureimonas jatrophae]SDN83065.1 hypothetical protein SAMN05192530_10290 [Aureimonas jatrophae]
MEQLAAFMLLVGCSPDAATCTEIPVPTPIYQSAEACQRDLPLQMRLSSTFDAKVVGTCQSVDAALLDGSATVDWTITRAGTLQVAVTPESNLVASR